MYDNRFESIDRYMGSWVISTTRLGTRLYLTDEGMGSDILARARVFRYADQADPVAEKARGEYAWQGFDWRALPVAQALAEGA